MTGRRLALIIGNSIYRDPTLAHLKAVEADVGSLAEVLQDADIGAFDDTKVLVNASASTVRRTVSDFFSKKTRDDLLLLYFSGHGVLDEQGRLYLAVKDTELNLLRGTAIPASDITNEMDSSNSKRQLLILDCCHSGAFARGTKGVPGASVGTGSIFEGIGFGRVILTATDATQYAWEGDQIIGEAETSLFTHFLVDGLQTGDADLDRDGNITVDELYDYVYDHVIKTTPKQTPGKWSFKEQGEIVIANVPERGTLVIPQKKADSQISKADNDAEISQKLGKLYTKGLSAFWLEEWEQAAVCFAEILKVNPNYRDAGEKLNEANLRQGLSQLYKKGVEALSARNYPIAITHFEKVVKEAPDFKDAAALLKTAQDALLSADLYTEAQQLGQAGEWQAVINVFKRIKALQPDYPDPDLLLARASQEIDAAQRSAEAEENNRKAQSAQVSDDLASTGTLQPEAPNRANPSTVSNSNPAVGSRHLKLAAILLLGTIIVLFGLFALNKFAVDQQTIIALSTAQAGTQVAAPAANQTAAVRNIADTQTARQTSAVTAYADGTATSQAESTLSSIQTTTLAASLTRTAQSIGPTLTVQALIPPDCTSAGQTWISPMDGMTLMCVPAGKFLMGASSSDGLAYAYERPQHEVILDVFWIDQTEVTNHQFELFVEKTNYQTDAEKEGSAVVYTGINPVIAKGASWNHPKGPSSDLNGLQDHPVIQVSWNDAIAYCQWAGRHLPTEAQWEKGARGTDGRLFPWGNLLPNKDLLNYNLNIADTTTVGKYSEGASPYNVMDLAGNVAEWVADWYEDTYYASSPAINPTGPTSGTYRVFRGDSWAATPGDVRSSNRAKFTPDYRNNALGFRCSK